MGTKNEKVLLLTILIVSGVIALSAGSGVYMLQKKAGELEAENMVLNSRVATAQTKLAKLPALRAEREKSQSRLEVAESILPSQEEIENLVDSLSEFASRSGIIIAKSAPVRQGAYSGVRGAVKKFEEADFNLDIYGDFFQFVEFVNMLENYKRFIRVDGFSVNTGRNEDEALDINVQFATFTYVSSATTKGGR